MTILYNYRVNDNGNGYNYYIEEFAGRTLHLTPEKELIIRFESPYKTGITANDMVHTEFFQGSATNGSKTLFLVLHGFGTRFKKVDNYYNLIKNIMVSNDSISCAFINLPFHLNRMPDEGNGSERLEYFSNQTLKFFHQAVCDIRVFIDIAMKKFGFEKIIICGFSLGCILSVISMALDERISKGIFLMGGGNWLEIFFNSLLKFKMKGTCACGKMTKPECEEIYRRFPDFLEEFKKGKVINRINLEMPVKSQPGEVEMGNCFLFDPLAFAHMLKPQNVIMINSKFDHYFTKKSTGMLWDALGQPDIYWLNRMHNSSVLGNKKVLSLVKEFLSR